jgi:hypothetical protein
MSAQQFGTVTGSYGKGVKGVVAVNFSVSGGKHCDDSCPLKHMKGGCYAVNTQGAQPSVRINGERHEADPAGFVAEVAKASNLSKLANAPWVRFSAFGSIYSPDTLTSDMLANLRKVAQSVDPKRSHFPVETVAKADAMKACGFDQVRVSAALSVDKLRESLKAGHKASLVVQGPKRATGKNKRAHSAPAFAKAKELRAEGISAKVCPAIAGDAKCGNCTMCGSDGPDVIIYPMH